MKDELNGLTIKQAYFLDIKKYGYWYTDLNDIRIENSIICGMKRNGITFDEIVRIFNGEVISKDITNRFYKTMNSLNITIKDTTIKIDNKCYKVRQDNIHLPPYINLIENDSFINIIINKLINKLNAIKMRLKDKFKIP